MDTCRGCFHNNMLPSPHKQGELVQACTRFPPGVQAVATQQGVMMITTGYPIINNDYTACGEKEEGINDFPIETAN